MSSNVFRLGEVTDKKRHYLHGRTLRNICKEIKQLHKNGILNHAKIRELIKRSSYSYLRHFKYLFSVHYTLYLLLPKIEYFTKCISCEIFKD